MEIKHFDHDHLLSLSNRKRADRIRCEACGEYCDGQTYICRQQGCNEYSLHESCAKLPEEVQSPFHAPHPLTLQRRRSDNNPNPTCDACRKNNVAGFMFRCDDCNFQLDLECAGVKANEEGEEGKLHTHPNHPHPLELIKNVADNLFCCPVCGKPCRNFATTYACIQCGLYLHPACFERKLPPQIQHFYHPHPLTLRTRKSDITCKACSISYYSWDNCIWYYSCKRCAFVMDIDCTLLILPTTTSASASTSIIDDDIKSESEEQIHHFLHGHPLKLTQNREDNCRVCGKGCTGPIYVCGRGDKNCKDIYFHKSCLEYQQQICHPFHPYHPLTLQLGHRAYGKCNACHNSHPYPPNSIAYICEGHNCRFLLHIECSTRLMSSITYEGHSHLLQFRDGNIESNTLKCSLCKHYINESYAFTCLYCNHSLHFACGPLPFTIQHKCHIDPLFLTISPVEDEEEDDTCEFYCDACEEERDPLLPIYHCAECHYVVEIKCVISEVIPSLMGRYGDIELRSTFGHSGKLICEKTAKEMMQTKQQIKTTFTLFDILKSWSLDEIRQLDNVLSAGARENVIAKEDDHDEKDSVHEAFLFSDKAYTRFMNVLDHGAKIPEPFKIVGEVPEVISKWAPEEEVAKVGDYMVPMRLAPILKRLLSRYGDVSVTSTLKPTVKMYLFYMLCECIHSMRITMVVDITEDLLLYWWTSLKIIQFAEFEIQFAFDHLKRVAHAYFGLHVRKEVDNAVDKIDRDIQAHEDERKALKDKCKALKDKRKCIAAAESAKSSLIVECLREASILRHGKAGTFSLYR